MTQPQDRDRAQEQADQRGGNLPPIGDPEGEPDFGGEHDSTTVAHQLRGGPERAPDEATPRGTGGDGGMDMDRNG